MSIDDAATLLLAAGFKEGGGGLGFSRSFRRDLVQGWDVGAYVSLSPGGPLLGKDGPIQIDLTLYLASKPNGRSYGTQYRVHSAEALRRELAAVLEKLKYLAEHDDLLKCPTCKERMVTLAERNSDGRPFLSCEGATMLHYQGRGKPKAFLCRGSSNAIDARVDVK